MNNRQIKRDSGARNDAGIIYRHRIRISKEEKKREEFLEIMEEIIHREEWIEVIEP